jgi:hypothetical protein
MIAKLAPKRIAKIVIPFVLTNQVTPADHQPEAVTSASLVRDVRNHHDEQGKSAEDVQNGDPA